MAHTIETLTERNRALGESDLPEARLKCLAQAVELGAEDAVLEALSDALRVNMKETVILPAHRYEKLSRGKGWARKGRGSDAVWGERVDGGYRVGPGKWVVGGHDGFSRKGEDGWVVKHVRVGEQTWTVAS